jgi:predicted phage terminase large subunit-like protein
MLHHGQGEVAENLPRFSVLACGRRWGKSQLGTELSIKAALEGKHAWWVGPDFPTASVGWRMMLDMAAQIPIMHEQKAEMRISAPNGGWVQVKSAESGLRGEGLDFVVVDEAAHIPKFDEMWTQALRPALSDRKGGALFISTPRGMNHFYELYRMAQETEEWRAWQYPTWSNPFIDPAEIEVARQQLPALVFRQEYGAEFVQLAGALFRREFFSVVDERPDVHYVRSWDLAVSTKTSGDYTAGALVGFCDDGRLVIADIVRGRWEWPDAVRVIANTARGDGYGVVQGIECVGAQTGMLQTLEREPTLIDLPFTPVQVDKDKITRAMSWLARAEQGKVELVRGAWNAAFLDEVCAFPETVHDDQVDAVSGAVQMLATSGPLLLW